MGISENDKILIRVDGSKLILEFIPDPLSLAMKTRKWAKTTVKDFERESEGEGMSSTPAKVLLDSTYILSIFGIGLRSFLLIT